MASNSSQQRASGSNPRYHQDYVVRIRYNNRLPPPSAPPKFLDVPNTAFALYTDTSFASNLARAAPLNVEVDSELGMPLNLVPYPAVFDNDDSAIQPVQPLPPIDPRDHALLRSASSLGKPIVRTTTGGSNVSFLRRTEYISAEQSKSTFRSQAERNAMAAIKKRAKKESVDPVKVLSAVMRGFETANGGDTMAQQYGVEDKAASNAAANWKKLRHPLKPNLRPVETYPLLPHPEGTSDSYGYMVFKFTAPPTEVTRGNPDERTGVALLQNVDVPQRSPGAAEAQESRDMFDLFIPATDDVAAGAKRKFSATQADDDDIDDTEEFRYNFVRRYEIKNHANYANANTEHPEELVMTVKEGKAYFYPVLTRLVIRPKRKTKFPLGMGIGSQRRDEDEGEMPAEALKLRVRDLDGQEMKRREDYVRKYERLALDQEEGQSQEQDAEGELDVDVDAEGEDEDAPGEEE